MKLEIRTTNDIKVKERKPSPDDEKQEKLTKITTNEIKLKGFKPKGKPAKAVDTIITTANMKEHAGTRKKEMVQEKRLATIRLKKFNAEIKANKERERLEALKKEGTIEGQIAALEKKKKELEGKLRKK